MATGERILSIPPTPAYRRNLAALADFQPYVASMVKATPVPDDVVPATGRDGCSTFRLSSSHGRREWLGRSSMPSVSAAALFGEFRYDGGNVLLPAVLTGLEIRVLADRMPPFAALFVVEEDPVALKLATHLYDYADLIAARRLVFLRLDRIIDDLRNVFEVHPGFELPKHLLTVPHCSSGRMDTLRRHLEDAGAAALGAQASVVSSCVQRLGERTFQRLPERPRVAVLTVDPRSSTSAQVDRIARALDRLGWPRETCAADAPDHSHVAARLRAIDRERADWVLMVNSPAGHLSSLLPPGLPLASWFLSKSGIESSRFIESAHPHVAFAASRSIANALAQSGMGTDAIVRGEPGADDLIGGEVESAPPKEPSAGMRLAVLMDLPDDRVEAVNLALPSHRALWRAMQAVVSKNTDRSPDTPAERLLELAQRQSGTTLREDDIRSQFVHLLRTRIAPACAGRAAVEAVVARGWNVSVWGTDWAHHVPRKGLWRGSIPVGKAFARLLDDVDVVVLPTLTVEAVQSALDALSMGTHVVCRASSEPFMREYPGLEAVKPYLCFYQRRAELADAVSRLLIDWFGWQDRVRAARELIRKKHTVSSRLRAMADHVRERYDARRSSG